MSDARSIVTLEEAWAAVDAAMAPDGASGPADWRTLPVAEAVGRVLCADQHAKLDLPPFDKSAMDGYAIRADDIRDEYELLGTVAAGQAPSGSIGPGQAVKVMTGAPVPDGAGKVVMREFTEQLGDRVRVFKHGDAPNICPHGEDVRIGERILPAGRVITAADAANLASCGIAEVPVADRLAVAVVTTGDEVVDDPAEIGPGKIMNANGPMMAALCEAWGLDAVRRVHVRDDLEATVAALADCLAAAEIVVVAGGVSVGDFDYVPAAMAAVGLDVRFSAVKIKPGRPTVFAVPTRAAHSGARAFFGLPGNPLSVFVMFHVFVLRAAAAMRSSVWPLRRLRLPLAEPFARRKTDRLQFIPAAITDDGRVAPVECHGSAHILALRDSDGLMQVPIGAARIAADEPVTFTPLRSLVP